MKNYKLTLIALFFTLCTTISYAQAPPPPNGSGGDPGSGGNDAVGSHAPAGGGAPISGGLAFLIALGLGYGGKKVWEMRKNSKMQINGMN